jgi:hypothetical protein
LTTSLYGYGYGYIDGGVGRDDDDGKSDAGQCGTAIQSASETKEKQKRTIV